MTLYCPRLTARALVLLRLVCASMLAGSAALAVPLTGQAALGDKRVDLDGVTRRNGLRLRAFDLSDVLW